MHRLRFVGRVGRELAVELVGFGLANGERLGERRAERVVELFVAQAQAHDLGLAGLERELVPRGGLRAGLRGVDGVRTPDDVIVDAVLRERGVIL